MDDVFRMTSGANNSEMLEDSRQSSAVLAFLQLEREKVIAKLRRIEELLGRKRIQRETIDIPPEISQPLYSEEGFGLRKVPNWPTLKPRPRPALKGLAIPSVKKPYFGLKSKCAKQTIHEACRQQLPKLRPPPNGHLCQPMCDGCLHSYIVLYLGLEADKRNWDDPEWTPSGYPSIWNEELTEKLRHTMYQRRCASCTLREPPTVTRKPSKKALSRMHSFHEVTVPRASVPRRAFSKTKKGPKSTMKQPVVAHAPDLSVLDASMSNVTGLLKKGKMDPIEEVGRINYLTSTSLPVEQQQMNIANCVVKSMTIDNAIFSSPQPQDVKMMGMTQGIGDHQKNTSYFLSTPQPVSHNEVLKASDAKENSSKPPLDVRRHRWSSTCRSPFNIDIDVATDAVPPDASNNSKQQEGFATSLIVPRNNNVNPKGEDDLEIDLRIVIDNEENVSLEVENVRYRTSEGSETKEKESIASQQKSGDERQEDSSERTSAFDSEE